MNPESRTVTAYLPGGTSEVADCVLRGQNPDFEVPLAELFRALDEAS